MELKFLLYFKTCCERELESQFLHVARTAMPSLVVGRNAVEEPINVTDEYNVFF